MAINSKRYVPGGQSGFYSLQAGNLPTLPHQGQYQAASPSARPSAYSGAGQALAALNWRPQETPATGAPPANWSQDTGMAQAFRSGVPMNQVGKYGQQAARPPVPGGIPPELLQNADPTSIALMQRLSDIERSGLMGQRTEQAIGRVESAGQQAQDVIGLPESHWRGKFALQEQRLNAQMKEDLSRANETAIAGGYANSEHARREAQRIRSQYNQQISQAEQTINISEADAAREDRWRKAEAGMQTGGAAAGIMERQQFPQENWTGMYDWLQAANQAGGGVNLQSIAGIQQMLNQSGDGLGSPLEIGPDGVPYLPARTRLPIGQRVGWEQGQYPVHDPTWGF